jgi:thiosulfate dehydrogenase [quinone] large subunit
MSPSAPPRLLGAAWETEGFRQTGWRLMPLRLFLGITFLYASLQKLANPDYFRADSPTSVVAQMKSLQASSPIGGLLRLSLHAPTLVGLLIAVGELAVSLGILVGLWTRLAAVGGMLLSLTFFLTVSWSTTPYYYGSDIVFLFAWSVFATCGAGGVLSVDAWIEARAAASTGGYGGVDLTRRRILIGARSTAVLAGVAAVVGGATAIIGRAAGGSRRPTARPAALDTNPTGGTPTTGSTPGSGSSSRTPTHRPRHKSSASSSGTAVFPVSTVPVGQARQFTDPASGGPGWVVRRAAATVVAFSAVCTHAGCTVGFDASAKEFVCPCHGGRYSARTGAVLGGPPPSPLPRIPSRIVNNEIRVD